MLTTAVKEIAVPVLAKWRLNRDIRSSLRQLRIMQFDLQEYQRVAERFSDPAKALRICNELIPSLEKVLRTFSPVLVDEMYEVAILPKLNELEALCLDTGNGGGGT